MGDKLNKYIGYYFTEGRHYNTQMIAMCHKPSQIFNTARMSCDTFYIVTSNEPDLFSNFNITYIGRHNFHDMIKELSSKFTMVQTF